MSAHCCETCWQLADCSRYPRPVETGMEPLRKRNTRVKQYQCSTKLVIMGKAHIHQLVRCESAGWKSRRLASVIDSYAADRSRVRSGASGWRVASRANRVHTLMRLCASSRDILLVPAATKRPPKAESSIGRAFRDVLHMSLLDGARNAAARSWHGVFNLQPSLHQRLRHSFSMNAFKRRLEFS